MFQSLIRTIRNSVSKVAKVLGRARVATPGAPAFFDHIIALAATDADPTPMDSPFLSLIVPVFDTPPSYLDDLVASVQSQRPGAWELILSDDGSTATKTRDWLERLKITTNIRIIKHNENRGIVAATNAGIKAATAPWVAFLDHDDALSPHALDRIWKALANSPECQFLYTDEVIADGALRPVDFFLKPAFDPVLLSGVNYLNHLSVYRRERLSAIGGPRPGFDGSQDYDLALRYTRDLSPKQLLHLPYPAYIWRRDGVSYSVKFVERATLNARRALSETFAIDGMPTIVHASLGDLHRVQFGSNRENWPLVSVIIPSRDAFALISQTLYGLCAGTDYPNLEIIVVDNGTTDPEVLKLYLKYEDGPISFTAIVEREPFNFARAVNKGINRAKGDFILWLNNDVEVIDPDWLKEMVSCFSYADVGIVGAKLLYPNQTLQHAGVIVGFGGLAGHWYLGQPKNFPGPMGRLWVRQSVSSVTGACLLVSRACLTTVGRLDEVRFAVAYNDVDFCMRARAMGYRVIWTPFATLIHHESASRGSDETPANIERFRREQDNLRAAHATESYEDPSVSPWYTKDRSYPGWLRLKHLPSAR